MPLLDAQRWLLPRAPGLLALLLVLLMSASLAWQSVTWQRLLQRAPDYVPGLLGLATCQLELGRLDEARTVVQRALAKEPSNAQALALRGRLGG